MQYLLDTGILLRLVNRQSPQHDQIRHALRRLKSQGHLLVTTFQNLSEFWNVCTRPADTRGGFGLTPDEAFHRLRTIERITSLLPDSPDTYSHWRQLILTHRVLGVQIHDTKLVAIMAVYGITHIITLNPKDFSRYPAITILTPEELIATDL